MCACPSTGHREVANTHQSIGPSGFPRGLLPGRPEAELELFFLVQRQGGPEEIGKSTRINIFCSFVVL